MALSGRTQTRPVPVPVPASLESIFITGANSGHILPPWRSQPALDWAWVDIIGPLWALSGLSSFINTHTDTDSTRNVHISALFPPYFPVYFLFIFVALQADNPHPETCSHLRGLMHFHTLRCRPRKVRRRMQHKFRTKNTHNKVYSCYPLSLQPTPTILSASCRSCHVLGKLICGKKRAKMWDAKVCGEPGRAGAGQAAEKNEIKLKNNVWKFLGHIF